MTALPPRQRAQLPDRAFAYVDSHGRRRLPIHDPAHVRNALARFNQVVFEDEEARERARAKLLRAAQRQGIVPIGFISGQLRSRGKGPLPGGHVTFLLADVEGSTALLRQFEDGYPAVLNDVIRVLRTAARRMGGHEVGIHGDEFFAVFRRTPDALLSALAMHRGLRDGTWPAGASVRVRVAIHAGRPTLTQEGYTGIAVHAVARIATAGHGGQILLSEAALRALGDPLPPDISVRDLGSIHLRGLSSEQLYQVVVPDLPSDFPPLRTALAS
jgi:class 3 adenylate cyclase